MEENLFLFRRFRLLDQAGKQRVDQQFQEMELTAMQSYVLRYLHDRAGAEMFYKEDCLHGIFHTQSRTTPMEGLRFF